MRRALPLLIIFVLALAVRLYYLAGIEAYPKFELIRNSLDDQVVFDQWAKSIVAGERFDYATSGHNFAVWAALDPGVYPQAPLYPFFVASLYRIFGIHYDAVRAVQMILGATACVLLTLLARRFVGPWTAFGCGLALAFFGPMVFYEGAYLRAGLFTFVALAGLYCVVRTQEAVNSGDTRGWALASGLALSAGVLLRPNYLLVVLLALIWLYRMNARRATAIAALGVFLPLVPIIATNSMRAGGLRFLSSNGPYILFVSNVHDATGTTAGISPAYRELVASRSPEEIDLVAEVLHDIREHPVAFLRLQLRKAVYFFAPREIPNNLSYAMARETNPRLALGFVEFYLLLPLALAGVVVSLRDWRRHLLLYGFLGGYWAATVAFYVLSRLRQPVVPVLLIFCGLAIEAWWRTARDQRWGPASLSAAAVLVATILLHPGAPWHRSADYQMAAAAHFSAAGELEEVGDLETATRHYARTVGLNPDFEQAMVALGRLGFQPAPAGPEILALCEEGRQALAEGRQRRAVGLVERAVKLAPDSAAPYRCLANVEFLIGDRHKALKTMEKAVELDPFAADLRQNLKRLRGTS